MWIIGHGGGTEDITEYYKTPILDSIWNALSYPVEMNVIRINGGQEKGIIFPVKNVLKTPNSIFPIQEYDWKDVKKRISPLVNTVVNTAAIR